MLKALVAHLKTSRAIVHAIAKEHPCMCALLNVYLDSRKNLSVSSSPWYTFGFGIISSFVKFTLQGL
jgi:hypothetical protein